MRPVSRFASLLLGFIALAQLARFLLGWTLVVNGVDVPAWPSAIAALFLGVTAVLLWRESRH
jgi:hypothetical protein